MNNVRGMEGEHEGRGGGSGPISKNISAVWTRFEHLLLARYVHSKLRMLS